MRIFRGSTVYIYIVLQNICHFDIIHYEYCLRAYLWNRIEVDFNDFIEISRHYTCYLLQFLEVVGVISHIDIAVESNGRQVTHCNLE